MNQTKIFNVTGWQLERMLAAGVCIFYTKLLSGFGHAHGSILMSPSITNSCIFTEDFENLLIRCFI